MDETNVRNMPWVDACQLLDLSIGFTRFIRFDANL